MSRVFLRSRAMNLKDSTLKRRRRSSVSGESHRDAYSGATVNVSVSIEKLPGNIDGNILVKSFRYLYHILYSKGTFSNYILPIMCVIGISIDPFFLFIPFVDDTKKCVGLDKRLGFTAGILRSLFDLFYLLYIARRTRRRFLLHLFSIDLLAILPLPQFPLKPSSPNYSQNPASFLSSPSFSFHQKLNLSAVSTTASPSFFTDSPLSGLEDDLVGYVFGKKKATEVAHLIWKHVVQKGDTAVDATCGNGYDTLAMLKMVADESGTACVYGFDIQREALESTSSLLDETANQTEKELVKLFNMCHSKMEEVIAKNALVRLVILTQFYELVPDIVQDSKVMYKMCGLESLKPWEMSTEHP
ncbi:hypothetical protein Patl1_20833 [Pistacia atlantica]|uniref:Uncharacterized protein n=1 Tax=Pistacia atlantica TaxID=434234 RepID=A0ACC1BMV9_9ROSI|nr:hypothetical protein Patl1_20833 [Pistacia atlantica]